MAKIKSKQEWYISFMQRLKLLLNGRLVHQFTIVTDDKSGKIVAVQSAIGQYKMEETSKKPNLIYGVYVEESFLGGKVSSELFFDKEKVRAYALKLVEKENQFMRTKSIYDEGFDLLREREHNVWKSSSKMICVQIFNINY